MTDLTDRPQSPASNGADPRSLYPISYEGSPFVDLCGAAFETMAESMPGHDLPRVPGWHEGAGYGKLLSIYSQLPDDVTHDPRGLVQRMSRDLLSGAVNWRCPELQYNLGAAVNVVASAMYALALDINVYLINDGLAGNAVMAEQAVGRILAGLSGADPAKARGLFTFGGTGTMAYAIKAGIRKAAPESTQHGVPDDLRVVITEDAHFSHATAADWLGLGSYQLVVVPATATRRSDLVAAETLLREQIEQGARIATIIINGGTTYDHTIDDIQGFAELRDKLVADYQLSYRPHLHVDSVVGWVWLTYRDHPMRPDDLGVDTDTVVLLQRQYQRIAQTFRADSWGVDFHKGVGGCPVDCSFIQFNDRADLVRLRRGGIGDTRLHQLAEEFSDVSPVDYTLETSRAGGKAIAALACLHSLGRRGYQQVIARLMESTRTFRRSIESHPQMVVLNRHALGYQTMVRLIAPEAAIRSADEQLYGLSSDHAQGIATGNAYLKEFFAWDNRTRMNTHGGGVVYSFSSQYVRTASGQPISGLKFCPTTPHIAPSHMDHAVKLLAKRKARFDRMKSDNGR